MCWYSAEHSGQQLVDAEAGERLCIREMHHYARWVVKEADLKSDRPKPVCLLDGTSVLFRPSEPEQASLGIDPEAEAVFRMLKNPKRDVFEWPDGAQIPVNNLPVGLVFDVMKVPGKEIPAVPISNDETTRELVTAATNPRPSVLARARRFF